MEEGQPVFIGVDGGGSRCRARVRDAHGRLLAMVEGGSANVYLDLERALGTVGETVARALATAGVSSETSGPMRLGFGLAGVSTPDVAALVQDRLASLGHVHVTDDATVACLGAHGGRDGGLIVAGTGSVAVARVDGRFTRVGGRGFILSDDGSGARLGQDALRRALRAHDGLEPHTGLTRSLMDAFGNEPLAMITWARTARSSDFAQYGPLVFDHAAQGDAAAVPLVLATAAAIAGLALALQERGVERLALVGGLASALIPYLPRAMTDRLTPPQFDAVEGALLLAGCPFARPDGPVVSCDG